METLVDEKENLIIIKILDSHLEVSNSKRLKNTILSHIEERSNQEVSFIIDLANVKFIDSSGLGSLLSIYKIIATPQFICIGNVQPGVLNTFKLVHLDHVMRIFPSLEDAKQECQNFRSSLE